MMSFFQKQYNEPINIKKTSLRVSKISLKVTNEKKMSWNTFYKGSMTVEAALLMPIFLFAILNLLSIIDIIRMQSNIQAAMCETIKEVSSYAYVEQNKEEESIIADLLEKSVIKEKIKDKTGKKYLDQSMVKDGSNGLWFIRCDVMKQNDLIDFEVRYRISPYFQIASWNDIFMINRCRMHAWTGYDQTLEKNFNGDERKVFVTEMGEVYHAVSSCKHLVVHIETISENALVQARNEYGEKYHECEKCRNKKTNGNYYITTTGNRYHTDIGCSGLKRTIKEVKLSEVSLPACKDCVW